MRFLSTLLAAATAMAHVVARQSLVTRRASSFPPRVTDHRTRASRNRGTTQYAGEFTPLTESTTLANIRAFFLVVQESPCATASHHEHRPRTTGQLAMEPDSPERPSAASPRDFVMRSLLPLAALLLVVSTPWIGPWGLLLATVGWWNVVKRIR